MADDANLRAVIGGNNPPDPFTAIKVHIDDLMTEARNWCDGQAVESQAQADEVGRLIDNIRQAAKAADEARVAENKPFDEGKAAVQAKYAPLIADTKAQRGCLVIALDALKNALAPFLRKQEEERLERARIAQEEAERIAREAAEAVRAAEATNLEAREAAEALVSQAAQAQSAANHIANDRSKAAGGAKAISLRTIYKPVLVEPKAALTHYVTTNPEAVKAFLVTLAEADVRAGKRQLPGFEITEEKVAV